MHTGCTFQIPAKLNLSTQLIYLFNIHVCGHFPLANNNREVSNVLHSLPAFCVVLIVSFNLPLVSSNIWKNKNLLLLYTICFKHQTSHNKAMKQCYLTTIFHSSKNYNYSLHYVVRICYVPSQYFHNILPDRHLAYSTHTNTRARARARAHARTNSL